MRFFRRPPGRRALWRHRGARRPAHSRGLREVARGTCVAVDRQAPRGGRPDPRSSRIRRHQRELGVRRREERADAAREADREARGAPALRAHHRSVRCRRRGGRCRTRGDGQGRRSQARCDVPHRRIGRGRSVGGPPLERVARRARAHGQEEGRDGRGERSGRRAQAQDRQHRRPGVSESRRLDLLPHRFADRTEIAEVRAAHGDLEPGAASGKRYRLAGRVMGRRLMGKAAFLDLEDRSDRIQLLASADGVGEALFALINDTQLRDIVGGEGEAIASRRGELTLQLAGFELLAPCAHPLPDLHHGLADVEPRYRQRYVDLMVNRDVREDALRRARMISAGRAYLDAAGFVEVETPVLQPLYGGASARPFTTHHNELDRTFYLRIATELYLKRLIVGGLERVYELGKDFRNEGVSFKHNPEFTMVEWYEAYADYEDVAARCERLVHTVACALGRGEGFAAARRRETLADSIGSRTGVDILAARDLAALQAA